MKVVIWARVSSREQREGYSIDAQLRACRDRAAKNGWTVVREFVVAESAKRGATGGGLLGVTVGLLALIALLVTFAAVYGLSDGTGLPLWASFLIVAGVYLVIAAIVGAICLACVLLG
jgi:hypothetical protein